MDQGFGLENFHFEVCSFPWWWFAVAACVQGAAWFVVKARTAEDGKAASNPPAPSRRGFHAILA